MKDHRLIDQRSLAFDRLIVPRLREHPELVQKARDNLTRWMKTASPSALRTLQEWESLLNGPFDTLLGMLESEGERAARLRQSSPFCGILSPAERLKILKQFQSYDPNPA